MGSSPELASVTSRKRETRARSGSIAIAIVPPPKTVDPTVCPLGTG